MNRMTIRQKDYVALVRREDGESNIPDAVERLADLEDKLERGEMVEVARHGRWIVRMCEDADPGELQCSNCGAGRPYDMCGVERDSAYCPRCGAKMDAEEGA